MRKKFFHLIFIFLVVYSINCVASKNNFQFQVSKFHTTRQSGQMLDMYIRYAMKDAVDYSSYPDYRELRNIAMSYLQPTASLPADTYWEIIAAEIGNKLMSKYPLSGISVQLLVYPNENGEISEPGFHGPIYNVGDIIPFNQAILPNDLSDTKIK